MHIAEEHSIQYTYSSIFIEKQQCFFFNSIFCSRHFLGSFAQQIENYVCEQYCIKKTSGNLVENTTKINVFFWQNIILTELKITGAVSIEKWLCLLQNKEQRTIPNK